MDISQVQDMYRNLLETTEHAICVLGEEGQMVFANPACLAALGFAWEDLRGHSLVRLGSDRAQAELVEALARGRSGQDELAPVEVTFRHRDGTLVRARLKLAPLAAGNGAADHLVAALRKVSA